MRNPIHSATRALILGRMCHWTSSVLDVEMLDGSRRSFGPADASRRVHASVHDDRVFTRLVLGGAMGAGEAYMAGEWSSEDLPMLLQEVLRNAGHLQLDRWTSFVSRLVNAWRHRRRANTKAGSERNIHAHYDLGNEFFRLFLDKSLSYSCARWPAGCDDLDQAQQIKFQDICEKLEIGPDHHVLEIGSGWGGLAIHAAHTTGCRVTGITVSREQFDLSRRLVAEAGLSDRVEIEYCDYRDIAGSFDRILSVEMFEAVGRECWRQFFEVCERVLRPGGRMLLQTIAIPDSGVDVPYRGSGWISRYIFPGGLLPAMCEIEHAATKPAGHMAIRDVHEIGPHYVRTLDEWRARFWRAIDDVRALGFDETFVRMWDFYLASCSAAFASGHIRDLQVMLERLPAASKPPAPNVTATTSVS